MYNDLVNGIFVRNQGLSDRFTQTYGYLSSGFTVTVQPAKKTFPSGTLTLQRPSLNGKIDSASGEITSDYLNLEPELTLRYLPRDGTRITANDHGTVRTPSVSDLQPFANISNPLRIYIGSPNLRPEYRHSLSSSLSI